MRSLLRLGPLVWHNLLRNRRRSLLTLASSVVSLALLSMLVAVYQGMFYGEDRSPSEALRLICRHRVSLTQVLPASHEQKIRSVPGVADLSAWTWFQGVYKDPKDFFARFAVDADTVFNVHQDWTVPPDQLDAFKRGRTACAVSESVAKQYDIKLGDAVTIVGDIYPVTLELTCAALFSGPAGSDALVFHREYLTELLPEKSSTRDTVGTFAILARSPDDVPRISAAIDAMFEDSPYPTRTESEKEFGRSFLAFLGNIKLFLGAVCAAVTFTILLVSANTVAMSVRERTREMAILRTLGFAPGEILQMVLAESVLLSTVGGAIGLGVGALLIAGASAGPAAGFGIQGVRWEAASLILGLAVLIGLLAATVPAIAASRRNVVESLRFTG